MLITCYDKIGDAEGAARQLLQAVDLSRRDIKLYEQLGRRYGNLKQPAEAERANNSIVEMLPTESESHALLAEIREKENRWPEAIVQWQRVAAIRSLEPTGLLKLANAQIHENEWSRHRDIANVSPPKLAPAVRRRAAAGPRSGATDEPTTETTLAMNIAIPSNCFMDPTPDRRLSMIRRSRLQLIGRFCSPIVNEWNCAARNLSVGSVPGLGGLHELATRRRDVRPQGMANGDRKPFSVQGGGEPALPSHIRADKPGRRQQWRCTGSD